MKNSTIITLGLIVVAALFLLSACSSADEAAKVASKYTEQTAKAIIEGCWQIAGAIIIAAIIRGAMNK